MAKKQIVIYGVVKLDYLVTFLEGVISFISPCMLPLIPIYISYLTAEKKTKGSFIVRPIGFVAGFTLVFVALGTFAGAVSQLLSSHQTIVNIVSGLIVIIFGLSYLEVIRLPFFKGIQKKQNVNSFFSALLFGAVFSVSLTPCVGAFLGSALMMASTSGTVLKGALLLLLYSLGLGIPFILSALFIEKVKTAFDAIKKHYKTINTVCGIFLIVIGLLMATGLFNRLIHAII